MQYPGASFGGTSQEDPSNSGSVQQYGREQNPFYLTKEITYYETGSKRHGKRVIICQNENGPCPLLALVNTLMLRDPVVDTKNPFIHPSPLHQITRAISGDPRPSVTAEELFQALYEILLTLGVQDEQLERIASQLPRLVYGLDVDPNFFAVDQFQNDRNDVDAVAIFKAFGVPLVHGWIAPTTNAEMHEWAMVETAAQDSSPDQKGKSKQSLDVHSENPFDSYSEENVETVIENLRRFPSYDSATTFLAQMEDAAPDPVSIRQARLIRRFLGHPYSPQQLTPAGTKSIAEYLLGLHSRQGSRSEHLCVLFRASHFSTIRIHPDTTIHNHPEQGQNDQTLLDLGSSTASNSANINEGPGLQDHPLVLALVTDQGYIPSGDDVVWEAIDERALSPIGPGHSSSLFSAEGIPQDIVRGARDQNGETNDEQDYAMALQMQIDEDDRHARWESQKNAWAKTSKNKPTSRFGSLGADNADRGATKEKRKGRDKCVIQ